MEFWLIVVVLIALSWPVAAFFDWLAAKKKAKIERIREKHAEISKGIRKLEVLKAQNEEDRQAIQVLAQEKSDGFPWLADAYADYLHLQDLKRARYLQNKKHPARKAAEHVREVAKERRKAEKLYRVLKYQLEYYERLFPWLIEFKGEDVDDLIRRIVDGKENDEESRDEPEDRARKWLTEAEYEKLPRVAKYQLALDRYWQKKKTRWEIGRDYERYIGYLYERAGGKVYYHGIVAGLADLGRDLIVMKGDNIEIVQCKCWSQKKTIHEKHIFQLFGTTIEYWLKHTSKQVAVFPELLR